MPALKHGYLLLLALALGCEGPTLWVGALRDAEVDADDADVEMVDASVDARVIVRDAQARDGGGQGMVPLIKCFSNEVCPRELPRCHSDIGFCTQCEFDRDCKQDEWCDYWACRDKDDRGPGGGTMGGAP